jgi:hypothetical protein
MEDLAPPLQLVLHLRAAIENGESVRAGLKQYLRSSQSDYASQVGKWFFKYENEETSSFEEIRGIYRRGVLRLAERGLRGETIYPVLCEMEMELIEVSRVEIEKFVQLLPVKLLLPLMLFQFPAYMILILGPLIKNFLESV